MAHTHIKGQNINLLIDGAVVAASSSCDFSISANTTDASAKDDKGLGFWDNPEFTYYDWSASNESFLVTVQSLSTLLDKVINGDATVDVAFQIEGDIAVGQLAYTSTAVISSIDVDASNGDYVKLTISLEGASPLTSSNVTEITPASEYRAKIRGKALMIAIDVSTTDDPTWSTIACSTSHKLSISCSTSDETDKDCNDKAPNKEVTGKSVTLSTENLILNPIGPARGVNINSLMTDIMSGESLNMQFGYYPSSIGSSNDPTHNWGEPTSTLLSGDFLCTSLSVSGAVKENATFSAEFQAQGQPTVELIEE